MSIKEQNLSNFLINPVNLSNIKNVSLNDSVNSNEVKPEDTNNLSKFNPNSNSLIITQ